MAYLKEFEERIATEDYPGFLKLWEEYCYCDEVDYRELVQILEKTKNSKLADAFGAHVERGLSLWEKITDLSKSQEVLKLILDIQNTNSEKLYEIASENLKSRYVNDPLYQEKLKLVGLREGSSFQGALSNFELLSHLKKGNFVFHKAGWGTCEIMDFSFVREEITLECDLVVGLKHLSFKNAFHTLLPLPQDHFLSRRFGNPDDLEKEAKQNPTSVLRLLLKNLGPKTAQEIKDELCDLVIPAQDWNRWWQTARTKLKKDTKIKTPMALKEAFSLREEDLPHEVLFYKALEKKPSIQETLQMVYTYLRDFSETLKNQDFKKSLEAKLEEILSAKDLIPSHRLQILFFLYDVTGKKEVKKEISELIQNCSSLKEILFSIEILSFRKRFLSVLQKERKDWPQFFLSIFFEAEPNLIRDYILSELKQNHLAELIEKLKALIQEPVSYPEALVWYFQKIVDSKEKLPFSQKKERNPFFEAYLILLANLNGKVEARALTKKMVSFLTNHRYKVIRELFQNASLEEIKEYLLLSTKCEGFTDQDIKIIQSLAEVVYPSLSSGEKEEERVIWTTQEGFNKAKNRVEEISSVETVSNAKEIEEARSHGDLRENAEYKSALERRDRLQAEMKFLSSQLNQAKILHKEEVSTEEVNVGTKVICKNQAGKELFFILLGPWDANPEKNILSFQSKFAQAMKGKKIGESFEFQGETYTIQEILNYLEQK